MVGSYLFVLRRRWGFVLALTAVLASVAFLAILDRPPVYTSRAVVEVGTGTVAEQVIGQPRSYEEPERRVSTQADAVTSRPVAELAAALLGDGSGRPSVDELLSRVRATPRAGTDFIDVTGTGPTARSAQEVTAAFTDAFLEYRGTLESAELERLQQDLLQQRDDAEAALAALPDAEANARERAVLVDRIDNAVRLLEAVRLRTSINQIGVEVLAAPSLPDEPSNSISVPVAAVAAVLGAGLVALALAFAIDLLRDGVRTRQEAEEVVGAPVLATVPHLRTRSGRRAPDPATSRALRLGLAAGSGGAVPRRIMVLAGPGEGDESRDMAAVLAEACRDSGLRVVVFADIAGDAMPPAALTAAPGGTGHSLANGVTVRQSLQRGISCGSATDGAAGAGVFDNAAPVKVVETAARDFDVVVIVVEEAAGVDPQAVRHLVDVVLVVCLLGRTPARRLRARVERLGSGRPEIAGTVLVTSAPRRHRVGEPEPSLDRSETAAPSRFVPERRSSALSPSQRSVGGA